VFGEAIETMWRSCIIFVGIACQVKDGLAVTPIQKVQSLLESMLKKGQAEKEAEATKYSAFSRWCTDQTRVRKNEISVANSDIEQLNANIEQASVNIRKLTDRIDELTEDVGRWNKDSKSIADVRAKEAIDFKSTVLDYGESVDAITGAVSVLKKQAYNRDQAESMLLQIQRQRLIPTRAKSALASFVQRQPDEMLFRTAPQAYGYEFQSGGVVEMLERLLDQFTTKKRDIEAEELKAKSAFEQLTQQLTDNIENAEHEISKRSEMRASTQTTKAEAEGDLAQTINDRDEDQKYLNEMTALCELKATDFASRQKMREEEIIALAEAARIISSSTVSGAGANHLPSFSQNIVGSALAQLGHGHENPAQERAAAFLTERAEGSSSRLLQDTARRLASGPFQKVKKMIKDLIVNLMEEATSETEHKGWCDSELVANKISRESRTEDVNQLKADIEDLTAEIAQLSEDIADLSTAIKQLDEAMATAQQDRTSSKAANDQTVKEAQEAQSAVEKATALLKEYYAKSAQATALVQQTPVEDAPETFEKPYQGMLAEGGNIISFLDVILSDFARLESETSAAEEQEVNEHKEFMFESKKDKALKETDVKHKSARKTDKESALHSAQSELDATQAQLDKAKAYYEKLRPSCVDSGITYEERVKKRDDEIQSLQEALQILTGQDLPTLA
jgi:chromosome segregation ATPase